MLNSSQQSTPAPIQAKHARRSRTPEDSQQLLDQLQNVSENHNQMQTGKQSLTSNTREDSPLW